MSSVSLAWVSLDCSDVETLANFWAKLLDGQIVYAADQFMIVDTARGALAVMGSPEYQPPTWPDNAIPKQMHIDLATTDLDKAEREAITLGARRADHQPSPDRHRVLFDPAGHPFCISLNMPMNWPARPASGPA